MINFKNTFCAGIIALSTLVSCNRDDAPVVVSEKNNVAVKNNIAIDIENFIEDKGQYKNIDFNNTVYTSASDQKYKLSTLKYIISNIVLIAEDGTEVKYEYNNPDKGAFIVNENTTKSTSGHDGHGHHLVLKDIPAGKYKKIRFGVGISPEASEVGVENDKAKFLKFFSEAKKNGLAWIWGTGFIFMKLEGEYLSKNENKYKSFTLHLGNGTKDNPKGAYQEVTLDLPKTVFVTDKISPLIHMEADFNRFLSGKNKIILSNENDNIHSPASNTAAPILENISKIFKISHIH